LLNIKILHFPRKQFKPLLQNRLSLIDYSVAGFVENWTLTGDGFDQAFRYLKFLDERNIALNKGSAFP